jgi:CxxC-x17-CxxC domain-containing protein
MIRRCSICGNECEVPFKPNPRLCQTCYNGKPDKSVAPSVPVAPVAPDLDARDRAILNAVAQLLVLMRAP